MLFNPQNPTGEALRLYFFGHFCQMLDTMYIRMYEIYIYMYIVFIHEQFLYNHMLFMFIPKTWDEAWPEKQHIFQSSRCLATRSLQAEVGKQHRLCCGTTTAAAGPLGMRGEQKKWSSGRASAGKLERSMECTISCWHTLSCLSLKENATNIHVYIDLDTQSKNIHARKYYIYTYLCSFWLSTIVFIC